MALKGTHKSVEFRDNTKTVLESIDKALTKGLEAVGMKAETYAKKDCPVDTGLLRNSITYALSGEMPHVKEYRAYRRNESERKADRNRAIYSYTGTAPGIAGEKSVYIGTNVEYAPYVEFGTSRQRAQPFLRPAATEHGAEYRRIIEAALKASE